MPLYEYRCPQCGHELEKLRKMSEADAPLPCPKCGAPTSRKIATGVDAHAGRKRPF